MNEEQHKQLEHLISMLNDPDPETRAMVARGLGRIGNVQAVNPLIGLLSDNTDKVRIAAVCSLGEIGNITAIEPLLPLMQDDSAEVRAAVIVALSQMPDSRAFAPIVISLFDADDEVRRNAAAAIGNLVDERALQPLIECLNDPYYWVRANAAWSLGKLKLEAATQRLIELLATEADEVVRANTLTALGNLGTVEAMVAVVSALRDELNTEKTRIAAMLAIADHCDTIDVPCALDEKQLCEASAVIVDLLSNAPEDELRATAAWSLGRLELTGGMADALIEALADEYEWVRYYAVESLALLGIKEAVPAIERLMKSSVDKHLLEVGKKSLRILKVEL